MRGGAETYLLEMPITVDPLHQGRQLVAVSIATDHVAGWASLPYLCYHD